MAYFTPEQWVALSVLAGVGILSILNVLASQFRHQREVFDLRIRAGELRTGYNARIAAMRAKEREATIEVDVIDEGEPNAGTEVEVELPETTAAAEMKVAA